MDVATTLFSTGWTSGVNAYATVALLGILGRAGVGEVPDPIQTDPVIVLACVMYAIEFVTDKIPYVDNAWDAIHTAVRPAIASAIGALYGADSDLSSLGTVFAAGGSGATAFASHGVKAAIRLGINTSPEPASNIVMSLTEDGLVAVVTVLALQHPVAAAIVAAALLALGIWLVISVGRRIRRGLRRFRARRSSGSHRLPREPGD